MQRNITDENQEELGNERVYNKNNAYENTILNKSTRQYIAGEKKEQQTNTKGKDKIRNGLPNITSTQANRMTGGSRK